MKVAGGQLHRVSDKSRTGGGVGGGYPLLLGGHGKFLKFAYPEMHSGAFSGRKSVCLEVVVQGTKLRLIQSPMRLSFPCWRPRFES